MTTCLLPVCELRFIFGVLVSHFLSINDGLDDVFTMLETFIISLSQSADLGAFFSVLQEIVQDGLGEARILPFLCVLLPRCEGKFVP